MGKRDFRHEIKSFQERLDKDMKNILNVAYILNAGVIGGGNRSMENLWHGLQRTNVRPFVVCPSTGPMWDMVKSLKNSSAVIGSKYPSIN